jgi:hypothetical protein
MSKTLTYEQMMSLFAESHKETAEIRKEHKEGMTELRKDIAELRKGIAEQGKEHKEGMAELRKEHIEGMAELRKEHKEGMAELRKEHIEGMAELRKGIAEQGKEHKEGMAKLRKEHIEGMAELRKGMAEQGKRIDDLGKRVDNLGLRVDDTCLRVDSLCLRIDDLRVFVDKNNADMEKNNQSMERNNHYVGLLANKIGGIVESIVIPGIVGKFNERGFSFDSVSTRVEFLNEERDGNLAEVDALLENGKFVIAVETKTEMQVRDVNEHVKRLNALRSIPRFKGKKIYGALSTAIIKKKPVSYALEKGFYVLQQPDVMGVKILDFPKGHRAKAW